MEYGSEKRQENIAFLTLSVLKQNVRHAIIIISKLIEKFKTRDRIGTERKLTKILNMKIAVVVLFIHSENICACSFAVDNS